MNEKIRVKIDENEQKDIFRLFLKKFNNDFSVASVSLGISRSSLSKYKWGVTRYIPKEVLVKVINCLEIDQPKIIYSGTLREIRQDYMGRAHPVLEEKYGKKWAKELTNRRDFKGISLSDFPDYVFVYLKDNYRKELFRALYNLFGSIDKVAEFLSVSISRLSCWCHGKQKDYVRNKVSMQFIPLSKLRIISERLVEDYRKEFSLENIEKHLVMYRMRAGNPIKNPKFPIVESPELVRLLFHLIGDGYAGSYSNNASYKNTCKDLLDEFKNDLKIFGDVPIYEQEISIKFPRLLAEIVGNFYGVDFGTFDSEISAKIFQIPKKYLYYGIRAFADDEGTAYSSSISLCSANPKLLRGIVKILDYLHLKHSEMKTRDSEKATHSKMYSLQIMDIKSYYRLVGFTHPRKKKILEFNVKRSKFRKAGYYRRNVTCKKIVDLLKSEPMTRDQLSQSLNISWSSADYHLKKLRDIVSIMGVGERGARLFVIKVLES